MEKVAGKKKKVISAAGTRKKTRKDPLATSSAPSTKVRDSIIKALSHVEAEDGLYFRNFFLLHEEDQRPGVKASTKEILSALNTLLKEGKVRVDYDELEVTFRLVS